MKKRYVVTHEIIPYEQRDVAHKFQEAPEELNPMHQEQGGIRQIGVTLSEEALEAYQGASNYLFHEEVTEVRALGWEEGPVETPPEMASAAGVQRIPADASTQYMRSLYMRGEKDMRGAGVVVAVLDTAMGAPVASWLKPQIKAAKSFIGSNPLGATGSTNHGTHTATTALPDKAMLLHGQVLDANGSGTMDKVAAGIYWAVEQGADILSISIGGPGGGDTLERAIAHAVSRGVIVRCAGGNEYQRGNQPSYPGACPSAEAVAAYDEKTDQRAPFSNTGGYIDLAGPGVSILAYYANGSLGLMSGTSMAAPETVWMTACLIGKHKKRGKTKAEISAAIKATARKNGDPATYYGAGIVRGWAADRELSAS